MKHKIQSKIELVDIGSIKPNEKNPRSITPEKKALLVKSIQEFPQMLELRPLIVDKRGVILGGNMRYDAAIGAGLKKIPIIRAENLTPAQAKEFIVKDNVGFGEWEWETLLDQYDASDLAEWGLDVPEFASNEQEAADDGYEEPDDLKSDIKPGDLLQIGDHRLLCGDSANPSDVEKLMGGARADMVFTDPPYGVAIGAKNKMLNSFQKAGRNLRDIKDDALPPEELKQRLLPAFQNLRTIMSDACTVFVTAPQGGDLGMMMMMMMKEAGLAVRHVLIWKKDSPTFSMGRLDYDYQHEPILLTWGKRHSYYGKGQHKTSVWEIPKPKRSKEHPTMKPVELVANAMLNNSKAGDIVCDWYMGSGTTMIAAEQLGRRGYGIEIDPHYCAVIADRMQKLNPALPILKNGKPYKTGE